MEKVIEVSFPGGKRVDAAIGGMTIRTDQPEAMGGTNTAPSPFIMFLASVGACAGFYALEFCQSRQIPTEGMALKLICAQDPRTKLFNQMTLELRLPRDFPEKYRDAIARAVDSCTVKKHLAAAPRIEIKTV